MARMGNEQGKLVFHRRWTEEEEYDLIGSTKREVMGIDSVIFPEAQVLQQLEVAVRASKENIDIFKPDGSKNGRHLSEDSERTNKHGSTDGNRSEVCTKAQNTLLSQNSHITKRQGILETGTFGSVGK